MQKAHGQVQSPEPRPQSRLLPLLPEHTIFYAALPNYGEASHQFLTIFQQELNQDAELRRWWTSGNMATEGPKVIDSLEKFYALSQYLGDEIVLSAESHGSDRPALLVVAEVRKPGLKKFLEQALTQLGGKSKPWARVLDADGLATAKDVAGNQQAEILVLPDLVVGAADVATLRKFQAQLEANAQAFPSTTFGQRISKSYEGGVTAMAGLDLQSILAKLPQSDQKNQATLELTGFSDMKHLIWEHKNIAGQPASQFELSFTGPRRGMASWLSAPAPMPSLDFVSPNALMVGSVLLKNPAEMFDDIRSVASASNPNALASLAQMEAALRLSLRQDLFARLSGEITFEMDSLAAPNPVWKVFLKSNDPSGLLATLRAFFVASRITPLEVDEDGITYHTIQIPSPQKSQSVSFAMVEGYLILAQNREAVADAVRVHRSGESLAGSPHFQASLPTGSLAQASAMLYEDPLAMAAVNLRKISPELADSFSASGAHSPSAVMLAYGDDTAIREISRSQSFDVGAALIGGAIAIPNLLRARIAANDASAVASIRTVNTAQISYAGAFPQKGFARSLAALGSDPSANATSAQHASLIDATLGDSSCTAGKWCTKAGYRFTVVSDGHRQGPCREFAVVATPVSASSGSRNFCSTSDAVVRSQLGPPLASPITVPECQSWAPLH